MSRINNLDWIYRSSIIRKKLGIDENGAIDIENILANQNDFTLVYRVMSESISGLCIKDGPNKIIVINSSLSKGRQRFTLAHELCHIYYHDDGCYVCFNKLDNDNSNDYEKEADLFASYFLAPFNSFKESFYYYLGECSNRLEVIIRLENVYGMSHLAVLFRLKNEGLITKKEYEIYSEMRPAKKAMNLGYDANLYFPTNINKTTGRYIRLAVELKEKELISQGKYEELLLSAFRDDLVYGDISYDKVD